MRRTAERSRGNLPRSVTRFVGRRREIAEIRALLGRSRLVTLTGFGGAGKTRLAVEVAGRSRRDFPGGAWMIDLSAVTDGSAVPQAVIRALGIINRSQDSATDKVAAHFGDARALLVLDSCEHLGDACAAFAGRLLARTRGARILATSRRALGIPGEHLFEVPPLPAPAAGGPVSAAALSQYDSVTLLADRTAALRPDFRITEENGPSVARLCAQLDGLPLAIELAAGRLRTLSPEQLADRLEGRFAVLTSGSPVAGPRQQTLRAVFDWSYELCSEPERVLWARLSVFAGPFELPAAEAVCAGDGLPEESVLEVLEGLVAQSIVLAGAAGDHVRFRLLDTVRQYGRERLAESGQERESRFRHRDYYLALAERLAAAWCGPEQASALAALRAKHDDLRAALETSMTDPAGPAAAVALVVALRQHWYVDGFLAEGRKWLDRALGLPGQEEARKPGGGRADALWVAAWVCLLLGDVAAGLERLDECDQLAAALGDRRAAGFARSIRGSTELFAGQPRRALGLLEEARTIFEAIGDDEGLLWAAFQLAVTRAYLRDSEAAQAICQESLRISEALGERLVRSYMLWVAGYEPLLRGRTDGEAAERAALAIQRGFNDPVGAALIIETLAWMAGQRGDPAEAARLLATAESAWSLADTTIAAFGKRPAALHADCEARVNLALGERGLPAARRRFRYDNLAEAIAAVLGQAGPARPGAGDNPLTERERQIAALVAEGLSNRAIAERLVISPRTVDGHVERILAKLGFTSRARVAAWVTSGSR